MNAEEFMNKEEIRREFFEDWLVNVNRNEIVEKLIQNDERAKKIRELEQELQHEKEVSQLTQSRLNEANIVIQMMIEEIMIKRCYTYVEPAQWNSLKQEILDGYFKNIGGDKT